MLSAVYSRRASRRHGGTAATSGRPRPGHAAGGSETGGWRTPPQSAAVGSAEPPRQAGRGASRTLVVRSPDREAAPEPARASVQPLAAEAGVDAWPRIRIGGIAGAGGAALSRELKTIGDALLGKAFAPGAGWRERIVLITSPGRGEGKTFVARELAATLVRSARRPVLLVDAGAPSQGGSDLASLLDLAAAPGLADALMAGDGDVERLVRPTDLDRLTLLGPGSTRPCPLALLASRRMVHLVKALLAGDPERLILIDGPGLLVEPRARVLALFAGQIALVVEAGVTPCAAIEQARLRLADHPGVGLILNRQLRLGPPWWPSRRSARGRGGPGSVG